MDVKEGDPSTVEEVELAWPPLSASSNGSPPRYRAQRGARGGARLKRAPPRGSLATLMRLFCGRRDSGAHLSMLPREGLGFGLAALLLLGLGLAPGRFVRLLDLAGQAAMERREALVKK